MRIDLGLDMSQPTDSARGGKVQTPSGGGPGGSELAADVAKPSADYVRAQALTAALSHLPEVRQERVAALAELVRGGNYAVSSEQTAEALMTHLSERAVA